MASSELSRFSFPTFDRPRYKRVSYVSDQNEVFRGSILPDIVVKLHVKFVANTAKFDHRATFMLKTSLIKPTSQLGYRTEMDATYGGRQETLVMYVPTGIL